VPELPETQTRAYRMHLELEAERERELEAEAGGYLNLGLSRVGRARDAADMGVWRAS
jgi:hypothetical protein